MQRAQRGGYVSYRDFHADVERMVSNAFLFNEDDTIGDLKKLVAAQTGTRPEKLRIQKWYTIFKDHITLEDYEIHDGMGLELYYN